MSGRWRGKFKSWLGPLTRRLAAALFAEVENLRLERDRRRSLDILSYFQACGHGVIVKGQMAVTDPGNVACGANVELGENAFFETEGGVTIGDGTVVGRNCVIETIVHAAAPDCTPSASPALVRPVLIGRGVHIGHNVTILPGVSIGDGATIRSGTVLDRDVLPGSVVEPAPFICALEGGNERSPFSASRAATTAAGLSSGSPRVRADDPAANIFFVVGTGRCGTLTISRVLSQHPKLICLHEPRPQMIRLSTEWAHGERTRAQVRRELAAVYCSGSVFPDGKVYGESDQKYFNLIPMLAELIPTSRFIWLIRDGRDVVASRLAWEEIPCVEKSGDPVSRTLMDRWLYYRLNGARCGAFTAEEWDGLSPFEKNCWCWSYVNGEIGRHLQALPARRWCRVAIEEFNQRTDEVFSFLSLPPAPVLIERHNKAWREIKRWKDWGSRERVVFERRCGPAMDRWYPEWRTAEGPWREEGATR